MAPNGKRTWVARWSVHGVRDQVAIASCEAVGYDEAHAIAHADDPRSALADYNAANTVADVPTFKQVAWRLIRQREKVWKPSAVPGQVQAWKRTVEADASAFCERPIDEITKADVTALLTRNDLTPTSHHFLRQRLAMVFAYARAHDMIATNPADKADQQILAPKPRNAAKGNQPTMPHGDVASILRSLPDGGKTPTRFLALTALRVNEVLGLTWDEVKIADEAAPRLDIPAERMKAGKRHVVPLSRQAAAMLASMAPAHARSGYVFQGRTKGKPVNKDLPRVAVQEACDKLNVRDPATGKRPTAHGLRSAFSSWCGDSAVDREVRETSLAHVPQNAVEAAYMRSELIDRRRVVMQAWADYIMP